MSINYRKARDNFHSQLHEHGPLDWSGTDKHEQSDPFRTQNYMKLSYAWLGLYIPIGRKALLSLIYLHIALFPRTGILGMLCCSCCKAATRKTVSATVHLCTAQNDRTTQTNRSADKTKMLGHDRSILCESSLHELSAAMLWSCPRPLLRPSSPPFLP